MKSPDRALLLVAVLAVLGAGVACGASPSDDSGRTAQSLLQNVFDPLASGAVRRVALTAEEKQAWTRSYVLGLKAFELVKLPTSLDPAVPLKLQLTDDFAVVANFRRIKKLSVEEFYASATIQGDSGGTLQVVYRGGRLTGTLRSRGRVFEIHSSSSASRFVVSERTDQPMSCAIVGAR